MVTGWVLVDAHYVCDDLLVNVNEWGCREKSEKEIAQKGASEAAREREQKESAIRSVDELRRAATKQGESYDILVSTFEMGGRGRRQGSFLRLIWCVVVM